MFPILCDLIQTQVEISIQNNKEKLRSRIQVHPMVYAFIKLIETERTLPKM